MKINKMSVDDLIETIDDDKLVELVLRLSKRLLDPGALKQRIVREKNLIDMRKDPKHESWMELR